MTVSAIAFAALVLPTLVLQLSDGRVLNGVGVWVKPMKFQLSTAVLLATIALMLRVLPAAERDRCAPRAALWLLIGCALFEIVYIMVQAARGEHSHFNTATAFARTMYGLMGIAAVSMLVVTGWIGVNIWRSGPRGDVMVVGAGLGLILGSILGTATGLYLGGQPGHWVGGVASDAGGWPVLGWSRTGGDLRVAHFVGLHQMQMIPATAWCVSQLQMRWPTWLVGASAVAGGLLTLLVALQAMAGRPLLG